LHSFFTRRTQPYITGDYTIFVAEVASTLNEALLTEHLLATSEDHALRRRLLVEELEGIRTTIFRQTLFAQFELDMHSRIEGGDALTADWLSERYADLVRRYYGPELTVDEDGEYEWARIPHFYMGYYVYQYATGKSAALALTQRILHEGEPAVERYLRFLRSGSSAAPVDLLREAGVDMTTPAPIEGAMERFNTLVDRLEAEGVAG
jgi:oligoendopeptidase F